MVQSQAILQYNRPTSFDFSQVYQFKKKSFASQPICFEVLRVKVFDFVFPKTDSLMTNLTVLCLIFCLVSGTLLLGVFT